MTKKISPDSETWFNAYLKMDRDSQFNFFSQIAGTLDLITVSEAAKIRGVTTTAIHNLIKRDRLRSVELFGETFVYKSEVENFERGKPGRRPRGEE
jgi:hypothetical protein